MTSITIEDQREWLRLLRTKLFLGNVNGISFGGDFWRDSEIVDNIIKSLDKLEFYMETINNG